MLKIKGQFGFLLIINTLIDYCLITLVIPYIHQLSYVLNKFKSSVYLHFFYAYPRLNKQASHSLNISDLFFL